MALLSTENTTTLEFKVRPHVHADDILVMSMALCDRLRGFRRTIALLARTVRMLSH